jgi:hypothetical protein
MTIKCVQNGAYLFAVPDETSQNFVHSICILGYSDYDVIDKMNRVPLNSRYTKLDQATFINTLFNIWRCSCELGFKVSKVCLPCCGSGSAWIRIHFGWLDPDPGGQN